MSRENLAIAVLCVHTVRRRLSCDRMEPNTTNPSTGEHEGFSLVVLGSMNPALHHPQWYQMIGVLTEAQVEAAAEVNAPVVELHTGAYAESIGSRQATELERLRSCARQASRLGLEVHAGHGLDYHNVQPVAAIEDLVELNIGHAIVARAVFDGLAKAVRDMKALMMAARA